MMLQIPIQAIANQVVSVSLAGQNCKIQLYQRSTGLFCNLYVDDFLIIGGIVCENLNRIIRDVYLGFTGDLGFYDTQGTDDPYYTGLGSRFLFIYIEASELNGEG